MVFLWPEDQAMFTWHLKLTLEMPPPTPLSRTDSGMGFMWNNVEISSLCCRFYRENCATEAKETTLQVLSQVSLWKQLPFSTSTLQFGLKVSSKNNVGTMLTKVYAELYCKWILIQCDIQAYWKENLAICHKSFRAFLHSPFVLSENYDFD